MRALLKVKITQANTTSRIGFSRYMILQSGIMICITDFYGVFKADAGTQDRMPAGLQKIIATALDEDDLSAKEIEIDFSTAKPSEQLWLRHLDLRAPAANRCCPLEFW